MEVKSKNIFNRFSEMGGFYEGVLTPKEESNGIGLVLFKPDATGTLLDLPIRDYIKNELEKATGKLVEFFGFWLTKVKPEVLSHLYSEQKNEQYLKYIQDHFGTGPVCLVLVAAKDAPEELNKLKGSVRTGLGVRGHFNNSVPIDETTFAAWKSGELDPKRTREIGINLFAANLLHIPNHKSDTIRAIKLLYPQSEIDNMVQSIPLVGKWIKDE